MQCDSWPGSWDVPIRYYYVPYNKINILILSIFGETLLFHQIFYFYCGLITFVKAILKHSSMASTNDRSLKTQHVNERKIFRDAFKKKTVKRMTSRIKVGGGQVRIILLNS